MTGNVMVHRKDWTGRGVDAQPQLALPINAEQTGKIAVYRITLPFLPPSKNVYDGWPNEWKSSAKRKWVKNLLDEFEAVGMPRNCLRAGLSAALVFPTAARRDTQNYAQCLWHWVPDALVKAKVIPDDTPEFIEFGPNLGVTFMVDKRGPGVPKAKKQRTHLSIALQTR